jgi:hypothetical protein
MIRLDELHDDQLAQLNLRWVPMVELYDPEDDLDGDLIMLCYDGRYTLEPIMIFELERLINSGGSRDEMILLLHEYAEDLEGRGWLDVEGGAGTEGSDLHQWGQLRSGDGHGVAGD